MHQQVLQFIGRVDVNQYVVISYTMLVSEKAELEIEVIMTRMMILMKLMILMIMMTMMTMMTMITMTMTTVSILLINISWIDITCDTAST